jgi:hypothetical protein
MPLYNGYLWSAGTGAIHSASIIGSRWSKIFAGISNRLGNPFYDATLGWLPPLPNGSRQSNLVRVAEVAFRNISATFTELSKSRSEELISHSATR